MSNITMQDYTNLIAMNTNAINQLRHGRALMTSIGHAMAQNAKQRIKDGMDVNGKPMPPAHHKELLGEKGQPLRQTGALMQSITYNVLSSTSVEVGTNKRYARKHQEGFRGPVEFDYKAEDGETYHFSFQSIQKREFLGESKEDRITIREIMDTWVALHLGGKKI